MLIQSLQLEHYRVFKEVALDLPEAVIGIIGPNGAGKTTLIEAVAWALYGTVAARTGKDDIKSAAADPAETCRVVLRFRLRGQSYRLERRLIGKSNRAEVELHDDNGTLLAVSVSDVAAAVTQLLGLDFKGFLTSYLARQQELNALSDLVPSKRREHLAGMLGVDRLDRALVELRSEIKEGAAEIELLSSHLEKREQLEAALKALDQQLVALEKTATTSAGARDRNREALKELAEQVKVGQRAEAKCSELTAALAGARSTEKTLKERQLRLEHERATLADATKEITALDRQLEAFPEIEQALNSLTNRRADDRLRTELTRQLIALDKQLETETKAAAKRRNEQSTIETELAKLPADLDSQRRELETKITEARESYVQFRTRADGAKQESARLRDRLADMSTVGAEATCDRCGRAFGDDLDSIRTHFESELAIAQKEQATFEAKLKEVQATGESLAQKLAELDKQIATRHDRQRTLNDLLARSRESDRQLAALTKQREQVAKQLAGIKAEPVDPAELKQLETKRADLLTARDRRATLQGQLQRKEPVEQELRETAEAIKSEADKAARLEREIKALEFDPAAYRMLTTQLQAAEESYEHANNAAIEAARDRDLAKREQELKSEQLAGFAQTAQKLEALKKTAWHDQKVKTLLTNFRSHVIATIRPTLSATASRLMSDMTDGRYSILELDEEYNLQMIDGGTLYPIEHFSGGEKDLANLCLRLAISQALTQAAGIDKAGVMLDEIFGSQDETRRELIFDGLAGLTKTFSQVLLVTHIEDIKNRVGALIEVHPNGDGYSEVKLHV